MSRLLYSLVLLYALTWSTYSIAPGKPAGPKIIAAIGGEAQFWDEVLSAAANASALRDGIPVSVADLMAGAGGVVSKLCFEDGLCWSDKMFRHDDAIGIYGMMALATVGKYCPTIPVPKYIGWSQGKLDHYFTEWVEGKTLAKSVKDKKLSSPIIKIPEKIVTSLAAFVYNLTTCPIPRERSKKLFR